MQDHFPDISMSLDRGYFDAMLRIALEGPNETFDNIIEETIPLWKSGTKYRFLYVNPSLYVSSISDASCSISSTMFYDYEDTNV